MSDPTPTTPGTPGTPTAALAPEEWAKLEIDDGNARYDATFSHRLYIKPHGGDSFEARERHALAALCLYEQPFGFTHEDVALAQRIADGCDGTLNGGDDDRVFADAVELRVKDWKRLLSLAARIASLLPEEPR